MRAAERARTSSRSSEEFTSSPISASVAKTSAETSVPVFVVCVSVCAPVGFMDSLYYRRRLRACPPLLGGFPGWGSLLVVEGDLLLPPERYSLNYYIISRQLPS